jgi:hypothetical protein
MMKRWKREEEFTFIRESINDCFSFNCCWISSRVFINSACFSWWLWMASLHRFNNASSLEFWNQLEKNEHVDDSMMNNCTFSRRFWISSWSVWVGSWIRSFWALTCNVNSSIRFSFRRISFWCKDSNCSFACRSNLICSRNSERRLMEVSCCCWRIFCKK